MPMQIFHSRCYDFENRCGLFFAQTFLGNNLVQQFPTLAIFEHQKDFVVEQEHITAADYVGVMAVSE
jgi:hypothetical protein